MNNLIMLIIQAFSGMLKMKIISVFYLNLISGFEFQFK